MRVLSLFDGISIARQALTNLGYKNITYFASEIDKYAIQIAQKNFPDTMQIGNIENLYGLELDLIKEKNIDLIIGGSPCQDLSIAKKNREGLKGQRSGLFYEYVRILKDVQPKYFVLENVASMPKEAKEQITEILGVEPIMINASLVSAQNRKRLFWTNIPNITQPEDKGILLKDILENDAQTDRLKSYCIDASYYKGASWEQYIKKGKRQLVKVGQIGKGGQGQRVYSPEGKSTALSALGGGQGAKTGLYLVKAAAQRGRNLINGKRKDILGVKTQQRIEIGGDKANAMTSVQKDSLVAIEDYVRKLTPIECERLQSLPDNYTEGVSNTQRYKMLGNGFNCAVIEHILSFMKTQIGEE